MVNYSKEYDKEYREDREDNKEKREELHICDCGGFYKLRHKSTHQKTKKHLNYISD